MYEHSIAMTEDVHTILSRHLLRKDGQEDICLATYAVSTGQTRTTRLLDAVHLPVRGDRDVHGNATIHGSYVLRIAAQAASRGRGLAIVHSHPDGRGWQSLSGLDSDAESSYSKLAEQLTGLPLVGLTLAGDETWSARIWISGAARWAGSVRRVGTSLTTSWNELIVPPPQPEESQSRTISAWGDHLQRDLVRLRVLVVGAGSVGLDVIQRLAATGIVDLGVMDYDRVQEVNRDRMIGATRRDARLHRLKTDVAARLARRAATAHDFQVHRHTVNVCTPVGLATALDYDVIFSCVDRPWPRAVLNSIAYADLIPVIDGGIAIDAFAGGGMRGATRRIQTATPGRPCFICSGQINPQDVTLEMRGDLDDPEYIRRAGREPVAGRPNVAALSAGVSAGQLDQFVSLVARPAGQGVPSPLRFSLGPHFLEHFPDETLAFCPVEQQVSLGDARINLSRATGSGGNNDGTETAGLWRYVDGCVDGCVEWIMNR